MTVQRPYARERHYPALQALYDSVRRQGHQTAEQRAVGRRLAGAVNWTTDGLSVPSWDSVMAAAGIALRPG